MNAIIQSVTARKQRRAEERRHHKEIVVKAAIENWKQVAELMIKSGLSGKITPLDTFMVHMSVFADILFDPSTNPDNLKQRLSEIDRWTDIAEKSAKDLKTYLVAECIRRTGRRPTMACSGRAISMFLMQGLSLAPVRARR